MHRQGLPIYLFGINAVFLDFLSLDSLHAHDWLLAAAKVPVLQKRSKKGAKRERHEG